MEGAYNKVFLARSSVPAPDYLYFVDLLVETIRDEIADCCASSYATLPLAEAGRMLFLKTDAELKDFLADVSGGKRGGEGPGRSTHAANLPGLSNHPQRQWEVRDGKVILPKVSQESTGVPSEKVRTPMRAKHGVASIRLTKFPPLAR